MSSRDYFVEYIDLRKHIFEGHLYILKNEYIHVLYKLYIHVLRSFIKACSKVEQVDPITFETSKKKRFTLKSDFMFNPKYTKEIAYIEKVLENPYNIEIISNDKELVRIFSTKFKIVLSKYAYQMLLACVEMNKFLDTSMAIFQRDNEKLLVSDNLFTESYIGESYIEDQLLISELEQINSKNYITGMLRDNYNFLKDLERVIQKKRLNTDKNIEIEFNEKYPIEKSSNFFLSNCPEYKNKYLIDFAKDYINRKTLNAENTPSVLMVNLTDPEEKVTCVENNRFFKMMILGFMDGKIKCYYFTEDSDKDYKEEYRKEFQKLQTGEGHTELLKPITDIPNISLDVDFVTFIGHTSAVTSISVNYDDFYMVSGSCDASIRLWNCRTGNCLASFNAHIRTVWTVKLAPKGYYFGSGGSDKIVYLWATNKVIPLKKFLGHTDEITTIDFTKNAIYLVSASLDNTIRFWNIEDNSLTRIFYFENNISCFQIDEVGEVLIVGDIEGNVIVWNVEKAFRILKTSFNIGAKSALRKSIQGIDISYDESCVIINTLSGFEVFDFSAFREDKSKDVYQKFNKENSLKRENNGIHFRPILSYQAKSLCITKAFFNHRNLMYVVSRNSIN